MYNDYSLVMMRNLALKFIFDYITLYLTLSLLYRHNIEYLKKDLIVIGDYDNVEFFLNESTINARKDLNIQYFIDSKAEIFDFASINNILLCTDYIIILPSVSDKIKNLLIDFSNENQKICFLIPNHNEISVNNSKISFFGDIMTFRIDKFGLTVEQRFLKRLFDIFISVIGLLILLPVFLIIMIVIFLSDKKNPFYIQSRITKGLKEFKLIKFRTMIPNAEMKTGPMLSTKNDSRITKLGSILRKTRLDEIPQLINVFLGQMSFVGPRPERKFFVNQFSSEEKTYLYRHRVKAGITGYAQVKSKYDTNYLNKLKFDLYYIKNYSLFLDIYIIFLTVFMVFKFETANGVNLSKVDYEFISCNDLEYVYKIKIREVR
jgi:exopolysaccharide biosynthesis polyprenyl glycosylphosphotransferase